MSKVLMRSNFNDENKHNLYSELVSTLENIISKDKENVFVCVGTSKVIGDAIGPLLGDYLTENTNVKVFGTTKMNINGVSINKRIDEIRSLENCNVIAIDASLAKNNASQNDIIIRLGSIRPGAGVGKDLPKIGNYSIIVNLLSKENIIPFTNHNIFKSLKSIDKEFVNDIVLTLGSSIKQVLEKL